MASKKHRPEEAVAKLRQVDVLVSQGQSVSEAIRAIGVTEVTYYRWRREFGGLKADQVKRLKELEAENARLRRAVSDLTLVQADPGRGRPGKLLLYSGRMTQLLIGCCRPRRMKGPAELSLLSGVGASAAAMLGSERMSGTI